MTDDKQSVYSTISTTKMLSDVFGFLAKLFWLCALSSAILYLIIQ